MEHQHAPISKLKRKTTLDSRIGTSTRAKQSQKLKEAAHRTASKPPSAGCHTVLPSPGRRRRQDETLSSPLAQSSPTKSHTEVARCKAELVDTSHCKPCSPPVIESAWAASEDFVLHRTSHCQVGLAVVRCKLAPNRGRLPLALTKSTPPPRSKHEIQVDSNILIN